MKINFRTLCDNYNKSHDKKTSQAAFARHLVSIGKFKNEASARGMMQYNSSGKAKSLDLVLLNETAKYFGIENKYSLIIE